MRRFSAEYLRHTREGLWSGDHDAFADLDPAGRERILDVGCGTGELARVLAEETSAEVVGTDVDPELLAVARERGLSVVRGDANRLPFPDDAFDLVVCQALLINLSDPERAVREFARVSSELVAAVEPNNAAVAVDSTVDAEPTLSRRARDAFVDGVETDVTLGGEGARETFRAAGLTDESTRTHYHEKRVAPPYSQPSLESARRKASGERLADHRETLLGGGLSRDDYARLRTDWRAMGREVIAQMREGDYRRSEVVPFYVTVGRV